MELGRLESVNPRDVWALEAADFTPWLLANADRLSEAIGLELELTTAEHPVGGFALDLVGIDRTNDAVLIVENQLGSTDHSHLGQVLTYAAGTDAATIVWIATQFREEHRQALDWLNENTREDRRFFGIKLKVVRIGSSKPAPLFELAAQPNDWQKQVRSVANREDVRGKGQFYLQFWTRFLERLQLEHPSWTRARRAPTQNWIEMSSPVPGTAINSSYAARGRLRHEIYIDGGDGSGIRNLAVFKQFEEQRSKLEAAYGRELQFEELPDKRACRVAEYREGDVAQVERHDEFIDWFFDSGARMRDALSSIAIH